MNSLGTPVIKVTALCRMTKRTPTYEGSRVSIPPLKVSITTFISQCLRSGWGWQLTILIYINLMSQATLPFGHLVFLGLFSLLFWGLSLQALRAFTYWVSGTSHPSISKSRGCHQGCPPTLFVTDVSSVCVNAFILFSVFFKLTEPI